MLCYIIYPSDLSEAELDSPVCLSRLTVQVTNSVYVSWISAVKVNLFDESTISAFERNDDDALSKQEVIVSRWVSSKERAEQDDVSDAWLVDRIQQSMNWCDQRYWWRYFFLWNIKIDVSHEETEWIIFFCDHEAQSIQISCNPHMFLNLQTDPEFRL